MATRSNQCIVELLSVTPNAEQLIERAGRTCYQSQERITAESAGVFIRKLIKSGHESVLEHASATFRLSGVSRALTHQLVRHRLCSFSQQSQRYVDEAGFEIVIPTSIQQNEAALMWFNDIMKKIGFCYSELKARGIPKEDARFVLPNACASEIVVSANFRQWRHVFDQRCDCRAQWEIREVCLRMLVCLQYEAPAVFGDFTIDEEAMTAARAKPGEVPYPAKLQAREKENENKGASHA